MFSVMSSTIQQRRLDDETLARQAQESAQEAGRAAFGELYDRHFERVYRYHLAHTGSVEDAQDLAATTFLAALESLPRYRPTGSFIAWLIGIAKHKVAMHYRKRRPLLPLESAEEYPHPGPEPEAAAWQRLQEAHIARALAGISAERAEAIRLCIFGDLTAPQAAEVMGKSAAAVKMLVFRGLKDLRLESTLWREES